MGIEMGYGIRGDELQGDLQLKVGCTVLCYGRSPGVLQWVECSRC